MAALIEHAATIVDCDDPQSMAAFYERAGGGRTIRVDDDSAWVTLSGLTLIFRHVEDYRRPTWQTSEIPVQMHMDFFVDDLGQAEELLHQYGATTPDHQPDVEGLLVMLDPAGHPFASGREADEQRYGIVH
jgi:hypothetical protein